MKKLSKLFLFSAVCGLGVWFNMNSAEATEKTLAGYDGICCQRSSGECKHPNGMDFNNARWISDSSTCTGHEE
ncbi:MAG: hypothetical protein ACI9YE_002779 [Psychroserpens sp.]|jgi:hypothetical protein